MGHGIGGVQAFLAAQGGFPIKAPLEDNTACGDFWVRLGQAIATTATNVPIKLPGRKPSFFFWTSVNGAVVYQTAADVANSTPSVFVCRATSSTTANLAVG